MVEIGKSIEVDATEINTTTKINARLASTASMSSFPQEHPYENTYKTNNDDLGNQTHEHDPDNEDLYENVTNKSDGRINRESAISSEISDNSNQTSTDSDADLAYDTARESSASSIESNEETMVTKNTVNSEIKTNSYQLNIRAQNVTVNMAN